LSYFEPLAQLFAVPAAVASLRVRWGGVGGFRRCRRRSAGRRAASAGGPSGPARQRTGGGPSSRARGRGRAVLRMSPSGRSSPARRWSAACGARGRGGCGPASRRGSTRSAVIRDRGMAGRSRPPVAVESREMCPTTGPPCAALTGAPCMRPGSRVSANHAKAREKVDSLGTPGTRHQPSGRRRVGSYPGRPPGADMVGRSRTTLSTRARPGASRPEGGCPTPQWSCVQVPLHLRQIQHGDGPAVRPFRRAYPRPSQEGREPLKTSSSNRGALSAAGIVLGKLRIGSHLVPYDTLEDESGPIKARYEGYLKARAARMASHIQKLAELKVP